MKKIGSSLLFIGVVFGLFSCVKEETDKEVTTREDAVEALQEYGEVTKLYQDASNSSDESVISAEDGLKSASLDGPTITISPLGATWPKTITVDFGTGKTGKDGVVRKGKMIITSSEKYRTKGSVHTTVFDNYYQNSNKIEGTHISTNMGLTTDNFLKFGVEIKDGKVTKPSGVIVYYTQKTERTWVAGDSTPLYIWDDEYTLTGVQNGVSSKGVGYEMLIVEPLHFVLFPRKVKAGVLKVTIDGLQDIEIDYAANTVQIGGVTYPLGV